MLGDRSKLDWMPSMSRLRVTGSALATQHA